jgi:hypothetical protein
MEPRPLATDVAGEGEPLVLIPCGMTDWLSWIPHQERLSGRYRTIRVQPIHNELGSAGVLGDPSYTWEVAVESMPITQVADYGGKQKDVRSWLANKGSRIIRMIVR